jgi:hypothetical protein
MYMHLTTYRYTLSSKLNETWISSFNGDLDMIRPVDLEQCSRKQCVVVRSPNHGKFSSNSEPVEESWKPTQSNKYAKAVMSSFVECA